MRVLLITSRFPLPPRRGNQVRTVEWLQAIGHQRCGVVTPAAENPATQAELASSGARVFSFPLRAAARARGVLRAAVRGVPLQEGLFDTAAARAALRRAMAGEAWDLAVVQMMRCGWAAEELAVHAPHLPLLFDAIDAMGLHYRRSLNAWPLPLRPLLRLEAARCSRREAWLAQRARLTTAVSRRDLEALAAVGERGRVVPVAGRKPTAHEPHRGSPTVLLSGNLGYRPTRQGALWFAHRVWPQVRRQVPGARWVLAGARPPRAVRRLAGLEGVEIHADPADLAPHLAAARVAIAPMTSGSGVPMKVLEAWAARVPVIASPWAAAGLEGEGAGVRIAGSAAEWIKETARLLTDVESVGSLVEEGHEVWRRCYRPERVQEIVVEVIRDAAGREAGGG